MVRFWPRPGAIWLADDEDVARALDAARRGGNGEFVRVVADQGGLDLGGRQAEGDGKPGCQVCVHVMKLASNRPSIKPPGGLPR